MLANSIFTEEMMEQEDLPTYIRRITTLLRREEVRRGGWQTERKGQAESYQRATWGHRGDPMELDAMATAGARSKETRKCFKCRKTGYIRRFCRNENTLASLEISENGDLLAIEESQDEEL
jgi:hypothetical protein